MDRTRATSRLDTSEAAFQSQVVDLARTLGYEITYHPYFSERSQPGWPDLVLVSSRRKRTIFAELKTDRGRLTDDQQQILRLLAEAGNEVYLWRPRDLTEVTRILVSPHRPAHPSPTAWPADRSQRNRPTARLRKPGRMPLRNGAVGAP